MVATAASSATYVYTVERHYYTPERRFEQSLDVYRPSFPVEQSGATVPAPVPGRVPVVLVMGSGWLGHRPYLYRVTNWWNSSAPKQICGTLGHPCVSIRHSGGFFFGQSRNPARNDSNNGRSVGVDSGVDSGIAGTRGRSVWNSDSCLDSYSYSDWWAILFVAVAFLSVAVAAAPGSVVWSLRMRMPLAMSSAGAPGEWEAGAADNAFAEESAVSDPLAPALPLAAMCVSMLAALVRWEGAGAARIDDMVRDVSSALAYLDAHADELGLGTQHDDKSTDDHQNNNFKSSSNSESSNNSKRINKLPIVFGGYSSGAHVAATLLTGSPLSPLLTRRDGKSSALSPLDRLSIASVLYVSGVLDVPEDSPVMRLLSRVVLRSHASKVPSPLRKLRSGEAATDAAAAAKVATPEEEDDDRRFRLCLPPHVLIGCRNEVFGWSVLDAAFCSEDYASALKDHERTLKRAHTHRPTQGRSAVVPGVVETSSSSESDSHSDSHSDSSRDSNAGGGGEDDEDNDEENEDDDDDDAEFVKLILLDGWSVNHWSILSSSEFAEALGSVLTKLSSKGRRFEQ